MDPMNNTPDQPVGSPTTPDPAKSQQDDMSQPAVPPVSVPVDKPTSPLESITTPDTESEKPAMPEADPSATMPDAAEPAATPQVSTVAPEKKSSSTRMYLLIALGVVIIALIGLYVTTLL